MTKACCESGTAHGHDAVSDAMSTMRLRFAEPVRFRFLVGMMSGSGGSGMELLLAGLGFVNAFTETCPDLQTKFYVQAELKQAGFKPAAILKVRLLRCAYTGVPPPPHRRRPVVTFTLF